MPLTKQGVATIGTGAVMLPVLEGLMHMGPFGLFLSGCATYVAYRHGDQIAEAGEQVMGKLVISTRGTASQVLHSLPKGTISPSKVEMNDPSDISILIGFDKKNKEVRKRMDELKSILILGAAGQGKSSTASYIISQFIEQGAHISIIDKHARSDESLSAMLSPFEKAFRQAPAYQPDAVEAVATFATDQLAGRIEGSLPKDRPYVLVIDEYSDIMRQALQKGPWTNAAKALVSVIEEYVTGGRKYNCFVICMGQIVNVSRTGGSEIRELFNTRMIHGMKESQAAMILPSNYKRECANLEAGQIILDIEGKQDPFFVQIPLLSKADVQRIVASIRPIETQVLPEIAFADNELDIYGQPERTPELLMPILPDKGPRAEDIDPDILIALWNAGWNSIPKLEKKFNFTNHQAQKARKLILSRLGLPDTEEAVD